MKTRTICFLYWQKTFYKILVSKYKKILYFIQHLNTIHIYFKFWTQNYVLYPFSNFLHSLSWIILKPKKIFSGEGRNILLFYSINLCFSSCLASNANLGKGFLYWRSRAKESLKKPLPKQEFFICKMTQSITVEKSICTYFEWKYNAQYFENKLWKN